MVFCCSRKLDSECMEVGRSCAEKHVPNMFLTYIEKLIRQTSIHAWGTVVGLVSKQQRYAVVDITFFGLCPETLSGARNWHHRQTYFEIQCFLAMPAILVVILTISQCHSCDTFYGISKPSEGLNWVCRSWNVCGRRSYQSLVRAYCINWHSVMYHGLRLATNIYLS